VIENFCAGSSGPPPAGPVGPGGALRALRALGALRSLSTRRAGRTGVARCAGRTHWPDWTRRAHRTVQPERDVDGAERRIILLTLTASEHEESIRSRRGRGSRQRRDDQPIGRAVGHGKFTQRAFRADTHQHCRRLTVAARAEPVAFDPKAGTVRRDAGDNDASHALCGGAVANDESCCEHDAEYGLREHHSAPHLFSSRPLDAESDVTRDRTSRSDRSAPLDPSVRAAPARQSARAHRRVPLDRQRLWRRSVLQARPAPADLALLELQRKR
jgi:hypothetical protein